LQEPRLTPTSFIVLGLLELAGEATPYELKQTVSTTLGNFWPIQHAQLYSEPERLAAAGYLMERREEGGRRRRHYTVTKKGRDALAEWLETPAEKILEYRDFGLLKLFFGADPAAVAEGQIDLHREKLAEYEAFRTLDRGSEPRGPWLALEAGIRHEKTSVEFWEEQLGKRRGRG
jgi:DNA-binding PadR family transcriptional regulator